MSKPAIFKLTTTKPKQILKKHEIPQEAHIPLDDVYCSLNRNNVTSLHKVLDDDIPITCDSKKVIAICGIGLVICFHSWIFSFF